jgi:hypothetical protein
MSVSFAQFDSTEFIEKMNTGCKSYNGKLGGRDMKLKQGINAAAAVVTLKLSLSAILEDYIMKTCDIDETKVNGADAMKTCIKKLIEAKITGQGLKWQIDAAHMDADEIYENFMITIESSSKLAKEKKKQCVLVFAQIELKHIVSQADIRNGNEEQEFLKEEEKMMAMKKEMKCRIEFARLHKRQEVEKEIIRLHKRQEVEKEIIRLHKRQEVEQEIIRLHKRQEMEQELATLKEELKKKELRKELAALKEELKKKELRRAAY